jgi:ADP-ribose pyrophosphatase
MAEGWPRIKARQTNRISPWMTIIERAVEFTPSGEIERYHAVGQQDYIAMVAALPDGRVPIVKQYRPALERFTWELPAGLVDEGEEPIATCRRELLEETGFAARTVHGLGTYAPCTSRLSNRVHSFYIEVGAKPDREVIEAGLELILVTPAELATLIAQREFVLQLHIGALLLAGLHGFIDLKAFQAIIEKS